MLTWYLSGKISRHICQFVSTTEMEFALFLVEVQLNIGAIMLNDSEMFIGNVWAVKWFLPSWTTGNITTAFTDWVSKCQGIFNYSW